MLEISLMKISILKILLAGDSSMAWIVRVCVRIAFDLLAIH